MHHRRPKTRTSVAPAAQRRRGLLALLLLRRATFALQIPPTFSVKDRAKHASVSLAVGDVGPIAAEQDAPALSVAEPTDEEPALDEDLRDQRPTVLRFFDRLAFLEAPAEAPFAAIYWSDPRIHSFGNVGALGALHAGIAPLFTLGLDLFAYGGRNIRAEVADSVAERRRQRGLRTRRAVDLGCGTGPATRALARSLRGKDEDGAEGWRGAGPVEVIGIDTSAEMLRVARVLSIGQPHLAFLKLNAEATGLPSQSADVVMLSFLLHEAPKQGRERILAEARRLLAPDGELVVLDIAPEYTPSPVMKSGEPYIEGYLANVQRELAAAGFESIAKESPVEHRATLWVCKKASLPLKEMPQSVTGPGARTGRRSVTRREKQTASKGKWTEHRWIEN